MALVWAIGSLVAVVWTLAVMSIDRSPVPEAGQSNLSYLRPFWIACGSGWGALGVLWLWLRRTPAGSAGAGLRWSLVIVSVAAAARVAVLFTHEPALSDDVYRYVFDGRNTAHGINPYSVTPAQRLDLVDHGDEALIERPLAEVLAGPASLEGGERWPGEAQIVVRINNPELATIYLPTSQWVFAAAGLLVADRWSDAASSARLFRAVLVLADLATIVLLLAALSKSGKSPWWAALYAWHPLPIAEIAGASHQDILGIALLVAALVVYGRVPQKTWRWTGLLALGALVKPVVVPVAAVALKGRPWGAWLRSLALGAAVCVVIAAPLWLTNDRQPLKNLQVTAERFTLKWAHFGSVYEPVLEIIERQTPGWINDDQEKLARKICGGLLAAAILGIWLAARDTWRAAAWIFLTMVLFSPAAHPWYVLWALALCPMAPNAPVWIASLTLPWGYAVLGDTESWSVSPWLMLTAYAPIYGALVFEAARYSRRRLKGDLE